MSLGPFHFDPGDAEARYYPSFAKLLFELQETSGPLVGWRVTICEQVPGGKRPAFLDELCAAMVNASGQLDTALAAVADAEPIEPASPAAIGRALLTAGPAIEAATDLLCGPAHRDGLAQLTSLAATGSQESVAWAATAAQGLEELCASAKQLRSALSDCWDALDDL
jgi:hypothetical protein